MIGLALLISFISIWFVVRQMRNRELELLKVEQTENAKYRYKSNLIALSLLLFIWSSCATETKTRTYADENANGTIEIIMIEGCEYYLYSNYENNGWEGGLERVNCNCQPDTTGRVKKKLRY